MYKKLIFKRNQNYIMFYGITLFIFTFNIFNKYFEFKELKKEEIHSSTYQIINIYEKEQYNVLKLKNSDFQFFTSISKQYKVKKMQYINLTISTSKIEFIAFLKGFYAKSLFFEKVNTSQDNKSIIFNTINNTHQEKILKELFNALFVAIPISNNLRDICTNYGINHLIAISGFHLGVISFLVYFLLYYPYSYLQTKYFPYRNKKFDISLITLVVVSIYFSILGLIPSFFRSFVMFILAIYFLRSNIKIVSYETLLVAISIILSIYPNFLFSLSFWFSITGVFYIFLYLQYLNRLPKLISLFLFNIWLFLAFNPIVHYFFYNTSIEQLLSPIITLFFTFFYPLEFFLHLLGIGNSLDSYLMIFLNHEMLTYEIKTPVVFFVIYILCSFFSLFNRYIFYLLNLLLVIFNLYLYL